MSVCQDYHLIDAPAAGADNSWTGKDRRRPGRIQNVNPALIPLLRNAAEVPVPEDVVPKPRVAEYTRRRTRLIGASSCVSPWGLMGLLIVMAVAIRLVTGHDSWIAFFGGVILSLCIGLFSSCQV